MPDFERSLENDSMRFSRYPLGEGGWGRSRDWMKRFG